MDASDINWRYVLGIVAVLVFGALLITGSVQREVGVTILVGILATLGVFEGRARRIRDS